MFLKLREKKKSKIPEIATNIFLFNIRQFNVIFIIIFIINYFVSKIKREELLF